MKKKLLMVLISVSMIASVFTGCGNSTEAKDSGKNGIPWGSWIWQNGPWPDP